jgi:predicted anti-sigma-YlaC factor YlaD
MTDDPKAMTCQEFQARLPELIGSGESAANHPHLQSCELCRALLADLETIAEAARQLFPVEEPPDKLWNQIESAIRNEDSGLEPA